ncbi:MAG TPA: hypothetical protein VG147_15070 [Solirubrobacteraceae bacterium]|jgi:hypothetical protein|nr:hypothetical protein [Solirubrobacteraceae bacterium]
MRSIKIMGLCLAAVFVMGAVGVATASASTPGFRFSGTKTAFSSVSGPGTLVQASNSSGGNGATVECKSDRDDGEIEGASGSDKVKNVLVLFDECKSKVAGTTFTCGSIKTNKLEGQLGYINAAEHKVGLVLKPQSPATLFAEFECETGGNKIAIKVRGEVIGEITPISKVTGEHLIEPGGHFTLQYTFNGANHWEQAPNVLTVLGEKKEGLLLETSISNVQSGAFLPSGIETTDEIFPLQSTEILG